MKEVDDGIEVQTRILERLEAASAIISGRSREEEHIQCAVKDPQGSVSSAENTSQLEAAEELNTKREKRYKEDDEEIARLLHWVVVGAGPTGVELCAEMSDFVR